MEIICNECEKFGMKFESSHLKSPQDFIEGNPNSKIWIIGLNPKTDGKEVLNPTLEDLRNFKLDDKKKSNYFKDFKKVSEKLYNKWEGNVAHTDLVKCGSQSFPPILDNKKGAEIIINNCMSKHLEFQIKKHKPKLIICNGAPTSYAIFNQFKPIDKNITSPKEIGAYKTEYNEHTITVILTGFIGRIDDWSKRRLGIDIEKNIDELKIEL